jgi:hypothetical protein
LKFFFAIIALAGHFFGCGSSQYSVHVIEGISREIFLRFPKGTDVKVLSGQVEENVAIDKGT